MLASAVSVLIRLFGITLLGYLLFALPWIRRHALNAVTFIVVNILFPLYFVDSLPRDWSRAVGTGWHWMVGFFVGSIVLIVLQAAVAHLLIRRCKAFSTDRPRELVTLFAVQNAGYLPLAILSMFGARDMLVYVSFIVLAFNSVFWTVAVSYLSGQRRFVFKINMPLIGIVVGLGFAACGVYDLLPRVLRVTIHALGQASIYLNLVVMGGILASIPSPHLRVRREFVWLVVVKMIAFPAAVFVLMLLVPLHGLSSHMASGIRLIAVLEAAVPPATNTIIVAKAFGTTRQVRYVGNGIMTSYVASIVTLPPFVILASLAFRR